MNHTLYIHFITILPSRHFIDLKGGAEGLNDTLMATHNWEVAVIIPRLTSKLMQLMLFPLYDLASLSL